MEILGRAPLKDVINAYRCDSKVLETGDPWPGEPLEQLNLLRKANRPAGRLWTLAWSLYRLHRYELIGNVKCAPCAGPVH